MNAIYTSNKYTDAFIFSKYFFTGILYNIFSSLIAILHSKFEDTKITHKKTNKKQTIELITILLPFGRVIHEQEVE